MQVTAIYRRKGSSQKALVMAQKRDQCHADIIKDMLNIVNKETVN